MNERNFLPAEDYGTALTISAVGEGDEGVYSCKLATYDQAEAVGVRYHVLVVDAGEEHVREDEGTSAFSSHTLHLGEEAEKGKEGSKSSELTPRRVNIVEIDCI